MVMPRSVNEDGRSESIWLARGHRADEELLDALNDK
jgi:hypothetical protein